MPSNTAKTIEAMLKFLNVKNSKIIKAVENLWNLPLPLSMRFKYDIDTYRVLRGCSVATIRPKECRPKLHIIYLHGGAYTQEAFPMHFKMMATLIDKLNCKLSYVDYPLTPKFNYRDTRAMLEKSYARLTMEYAGDEFVFVGDSAGGGLALAFAQKLKSEGGVMPVKTVLYSPWVDISMDNPQAYAYEAYDLLLNVKELIRNGKNYAGGDDTHLPFVSPLYGSMDGLGDVAVFYGTHEVLYPDCLKLREITAEAQGSHFLFFEYPEMQHDFVLFPIPEAVRATEQTCAFILGEDLPQYEVVKIEGEKTAKIVFPEDTPFI